MDNKAYLDQIAVKEQPKNASPLSSVFSPMLLKLIIGAVVLIILLIVVTTILNSNSGSSSTSYSALYERYSLLLAEDSAMQTQKDSLRSAELRSNTTNFLITSESFLNNYTSAVTSAGNTLTTGDADIAKDMNEYAANLDIAYMNGYLDSSFASESAYQLAVLVQLETNIINTTDNATLKELVTTNLENLKTYQEIYQNYGSEE
jgi:hypothetical protein